MSGDLPRTVGLCPNCHPEFYMPNAADGDTCPIMGCDRPLVIYRRGTLAEALAKTVGEQTETVGESAVGGPFGV